MTEKGYARKDYIEHCTPAELVIREAIYVTEKAGSHPLLVEAVIHLAHAKDKVSEFTDLPKVTEAQEKLRAKYGTPDEFANACNRAADRLMITTEECDAGVEKYRREWMEAGKL